MKDFTVIGPDYDTAKDFDSQVDSYFIYSVPPTDVGENNHHKYQNLTISGEFRSPFFYQGFSQNDPINMDELIEFVNCKITSSSGGIQIYDATLSGNHRRLHMTNVEMTHSINAEVGRGNDIYVHPSVSVDFNGVTVRNNSRAAIKYAGTADPMAKASYSYFTNLNFINCTGTGLEVDKYGTFDVSNSNFPSSLAAGVTVFGGHLNITNSVFTGTTAIAPSSSGGVDPTIIVSDCSFINCSRVFQYSGIWVNPKVFFTRCNFSEINNLSDGTHSMISAVLSDDVEFYITDCVFDQITGDSALSSLRGDWAISGCEFSGYFPNGVIRWSDNGTEQGYNVVINNNDFSNITGVHLYSYNDAKIINNRISGGGNNWNSDEVIFGGYPLNVGEQGLLFYEGQAQSFNSQETLIIPPTTTTFNIGDGTPIKTIDIKNGDSIIRPNLAWVATIHLVANGDITISNNNGNIQLFNNEDLVLVSGESLYLELNHNTGNWDQVVGGG